MPVNMYFDSFNALLVMDGHGIYVWSVYIIATMVLSALFIQPILRRRQLLQQLRDQSRRQSVKNPQAPVSVVESN